MQSEDRDLPVHPSQEAIEQQILDMEAQLDASTFHDVTQLEASTFSPNESTSGSMDAATPSVPAVLGKQADSSLTRQEPGLRSLLISTFLSLAVVLLLLGIVRLSLPQMLEWCRYAWTRGQLRAEYELAGERLSQVSVEGLGKVSQWVGLRVSPSVVHIDMRRESNTGDFQGIMGPLESLHIDQGSGVIVDAEGFVLTNHHVVAEGGSIEVHLSDGRVVKADVVGVDDVTDLALLKLQADHLMPIAWGDSDAMTVGMPVWAVGSPFGLMGTVTFGILSGKHRIDLSSARTLGQVKGKAEYSDLMQSDVAVNPGNSGGPLVNAQGELIGINTAIIGQSYRGISFAIPSNVAKKVFEKLRHTGKMERGMLGLIVDDLYRPKRDGKGIVGAKVLRLVDEIPSPAKRAGMLPGDIISEIDGRSVENVSDLRRIVGEAYVGSPVRVKYWRNAEPLEVDVEVVSIPSSLQR